MRLTLPDGTVILAQGRLDLVPSQRPRSPDFALYLDDRWKDDPQVTWPFRIIDWEDFGLPADEAQIFTAIADLSRRAQAGKLVEVACYGGVGRTGTVLGCLTVLAGASSAEAVAWVRQHYHRSAIETVEQEQLIARFAQRLNIPYTGPTGHRRSNAPVLTRSTAGRAAVLLGLLARCLAASAGCETPSRGP